MKLAVSNLAWTADQAEAAYGVLQNAGVKGLEIAPSLFFPDVTPPLSADVARCRAAQTAIAGFGLELCSMQSALFGVENAELFGLPGARQRFVEGMLAAIALAGRIDIPVIVLGSPKNRIIPNEMAPDMTQVIAYDVLTELGDAAASAGTSIALEANPMAYGTNFATTFAESAAIAGHVDHPAIGINLDLGSFILNDEVDILPNLLRDGYPWVRHVHISAPFLKPVASETVAIEALFETLRALKYDRWVSIEMVNVFDAVASAIDICQRLLGQDR